MDILKGVLAALVASYLAGLLFAYAFRVPIPLVGMIGPFGETAASTFGFWGVVIAVSVAWFVYGFFGGFVVLPLFGGVAGYVAGRVFQGSARKNRMIMVFSAVAGVIPVVCISTLDYFVGPW